MEKSQNVERPQSENSIIYTQTGRVSKAKKALKVHSCECGRSYTRAEHLRRHKENHASEEYLTCSFLDCGKTFSRLDLMQRHRERHREATGKSDAGNELFGDDSAGVPSSLASSRSPSKRIVDSTQMPTPVYGQLGSQANDLFGLPLYPPSGIRVSPSPGLNCGNLLPDLPYTGSTSVTRSPWDNTFVEPWNYPSHSPISSTMVYKWLLSDAKHASSRSTSNGVPHSGVNDPVTSNEINSKCGHLYPKSMSQIDDEEQVYLFPEIPLGMGLAWYLTDKYNQYLNNYWIFFHPSMPIIHRATFQNQQQSPMLYAAMVAIGAQYSDSSARRKSRILHDQCLKLLSKRDSEILLAPDRLCDSQTVLLVEVMSLYRARRASRELSYRAVQLFKMLSQDYAFPASAASILLADVTVESTTHRDWTNWIERVSRQRLLQCCYLLYTQRTPLYLPPPIRLHLSTVRSGFDLPFPANSSIWEALNTIDWAMAARAEGSTPTYIYEVHAQTQGPFDIFQTSLLIAAHLSDHEHRIAIDHLIDVSPISRHRLLTAKLVRSIPARLLEAGAGEPWIISSGLPTVNSTEYMDLSKSWTDELWATSVSGAAMTTAIQIAIDILRQAAHFQQPDLPLVFGGELGLYYAVLVLWTTTQAAQSRMNALDELDSYQTISEKSKSFDLSTPKKSAHSSQKTSRAPHTYSDESEIHRKLCENSSMSNTYSKLVDIESSTACLSALNNCRAEVALLGSVSQWPLNAPRWQQDCNTIIRFVKSRLCQPTIEGSADSEHDESFGEFLDVILHSLGKIAPRSMPLQPSALSGIKYCKEEDVEEDLPNFKLSRSRERIKKEEEVSEEGGNDTKIIMIKKEDDEEEVKLRITMAQDEQAHNPVLVKRSTSPSLEKQLQDVPRSDPEQRSDRKRSSFRSPLPSSLNDDEWSGLNFPVEESPSGWSCDSEQWTEGSFSETDSSRSLTVLSSTITCGADYLYAQFQRWAVSQGFKCRGGQADNAGQSSSEHTSSFGSINTSTTSSLVPKKDSQQAANTRKGFPDEEEDDRRPSKRRKVDVALDDLDNRLLACPFAKKNPLVHRRCFRYILQDINRVKQHLLRVHRIPIHCARCARTFECEDERDSHLREQPQCPIEPPRVWDGIKESQKRILARRVSAKRSREENWYFIYATLFPKSTRPESPFVENTQLSGELIALREFAIAEAPAHIAEFANSQLLPHLRPDQEDIEAFTRAAVRGVFDMVLQRWEANATQNTTACPLPTESRRSQDSAYSSQNRSPSSDQSGIVSQIHEACVPPQVSSSAPRPASQAQPVESPGADPSLTISTESDNPITTTSSIPESESVDLSFLDDFMIGGDQTFQFDGFSRLSSIGYTEEDQTEIGTGRLLDPNTGYGASFQ